MVIDLIRLIRAIIFAIYVSIESLHCKPETNIMLYANYTSIPKKKKKSRLGSTSKC